MLTYYYFCFAFTIGFAQAKVDSHGYEYLDTSELSKHQDPEEFLGKDVADLWGGPAAIAQTIGVKYNYWIYRNFTDIKKGFRPHLGSIMKAKRTKVIPVLEWYDEDYWYYTVLMVDRDSPDVKKPIHKCWLHWLVVNTPGYSVRRGETLAEYVGPWPQKGTGKHRYVVIVWQYPNKIDFSDFKKLNKYNFIERQNFDVLEFMKKYNFSTPEGANYFRVEWDKHADKVYKKYKKHQKKEEKKKSS